MASFSQTWKDLHPFDRMYAQGLKAFYHDAEERASSIWPGMQLCPVCIFRGDGPAFLYKHPSPPASFVPLGDDLWLGEQSALQLFGATQIEINGTLTAINDYDRDGYLPELFFAELFHEMHHVYQRNAMPSLRHDDPALVITYPEDIENDALRLFENRLLLQMVFGNGKEALTDPLNLLFSCREKRQQIIGSRYMEMERRAESLEGPATYCQYRFLQSQQRTAWDKTLFAVAQQQEFLSTLSQLLVGRQQLRYRLLKSGLAICLILAALDLPNWESHYFHSDAVLIDFLFERFDVRPMAIPELEDFKACTSHYLRKMHQERQQCLAAWEHQEGLRIDITFRSMPECRAIDPMNAEGIDKNKVLHNTMLKLGRGDHFLTFLNGGVIAGIADNLWRVQSLVFFLRSREQIRMESGRIFLSAADRQMKWRGEIVSESEKGLSLILD